MLISDNSRQFIAKSIIYWPLFIKKMESGLQKLTKIVKKNHYDIIIIGAGPAALIAAIECHTPLVKTLVLEKMHKPAMKLRLSGKGRCNITNDADLTGFLRHFGKNGRFLKFAVLIQSVVPKYNCL